MLSTRTGLRLYVSATLRRYPLVPFARTETSCATFTGPSLEQHTSDSSGENSKAEGCLFLDSVFPIRRGTWDLRHYLGRFQMDILVESLEEIFKKVRVHGFEIKSIEPRMKDGGVFINFRYSPKPLSDSEASQASQSASAALNSAVTEIEQALTTSIAAKGGLPSWLGIKNGNLWTVCGKPWREDMRRYASAILRVSFEGPDVTDEQIWKTLRPYGRILDLRSPTPVPAGILRSTIVIFERTASATIAHNCIYGAYVPHSEDDPQTLTRLTTAYEQPIKPHLIRNWLAAHPRIVFPVVVFLLGTLTYTVFDPIRAFAVQAGVMGWLDYRSFALTKWLRRITLDRLTQGSDASEVVYSVPTDTNAWKDRREAETSIDSYLYDYPSTITFVHGPAGSGKSQLIRSVLQKSDRRTVLIDCAKIYAGGSDSAMVASLAEQTGYWPVFTFLNSVNSLIDLASVGLVGQKAGLSSSLQDQVTQVLDVVADGLRRVTVSRHAEADRQIKRARIHEQKVLEDAERRERIRHGVWHDGRIDCVAGNGVISELGVGIEPVGENDEDSAYQEPRDDVGVNVEKLSNLNDIARREREYRSEQDVGALPVVVIKNFGADSKPGKVEIAMALAEWAADLVSNRIAHVIVVSDNRESAKLLAKALPTKPLNTVALADADPASSLAFINKKLQEASVEYNISPEETQLIERLGGRASDLETIIHKVRAGQGVADAIEDIIQRGVAELRKNAFGDDAEDAKRLLWTRPQAWAVLKLLAQKDELQYFQVLLDFPFKGDESPLRAMERAELISITTKDGRPSTIRPGKPVHRYVFQRLLADEVFKATQDITYNESLISGMESKIKSVESELLMLKDILSGPDRYTATMSRIINRASYLKDKMFEAQQKIARLEGENAELKMVLSGKPETKEVTSRSWWHPFL
ncbi:RNA12 protein-domain-containing protein [Gautieria morchelliformis]|nr:RNA12 protein-domain-containing protein [Gautieria morchelliformis]